MGAFESAVFYPPNLLFLLFPAAQATNLSFALHFLLGGIFMHVWLARRKLHPAACLAGGVMFMFCAPFFLRSYAGHLGPQHAIAWIPLIFMAIDGLIEEASLGWTLLGTLAMSMFLYAGYPQVVFYTGILAGLYALARLPEAPRRWRTLAAMAGMNLLAIGIWAVQLGAGLSLANECSRSGGVPFEFAAMFSFAPENWLTFLSPSLFGDRHPAIAAAPAMTPHLMYWGRCYFWEMTPFFGVCGLPLVAVAFWSSWRRRIVWIVSVCAVAGCLLAMGAHMPWFRFLYEHVPGFNMFRSNSKFIIPAVVLLIFLAAHGMDALTWNDAKDGKKSGQPPFFLAVTAGVFGFVALLLFWFGIFSSPTDGWWKAFFELPLRARESYLPPDYFNQFAAAGAQSFFALCMLSVVVVLVLVVVFAGLAVRKPEWRRRLVWIILAIVVADMLVFAWRFRCSYAVAEQQAASAQLGKFLAERPGEYRIFSVSASNAALPLRAYDMWGYASQMVVRRYAEFLAWTQGDDPDKVTGYQQFRTIHPRFDLMRCRFVLSPQPQGGDAVTELKEVLPRFLLVREWKVEAQRDAVFAAISRPEFNPRRTVLLERAPGSTGALAGEKFPAKAGGNERGATPGTAKNTEPLLGDSRGTVRILRESSDWQEVAVTLAQPAILVQTDLYTPSWKVSALPGSAQTAYELIPANYILRGVPLTPGTHRLRIEYRPTMFVVGKWVSLASLALFLGLAGWWGWRFLRARKVESR